MLILGTTLFILIKYIGYGCVRRFMLFPQYGRLALSYRISIEFMRACIFAVVDVLLMLIGASATLHGSDLDEFAPSKIRSLSTSACVVFWSIKATLSLRIVILLMRRN